MRTTKKDFELFKQCFLKYVEVLGLKDWSIHFDHDKQDGVYANTFMNGDGMVATVVFSTVWDDLRPKTEHEIERLALHECLHLLMNPLLREAKERYTTPYTLESLEHQVIRRLEHLI